MKQEKPQHSLSSFSPLQTLLCSFTFPSKENERNRDFSLLIFLFKFLLFLYICEHKLFELFIAEFVVFVRIVGLEHCLIE